MSNYTLRNEKAERFNDRAIFCHPCCDGIQCSFPSKCGFAQCNKRYSRSTNNRNASRSISLIGGDRYRFFIHWLDHKEKPKLRFDKPTADREGYHSIRIHNTGKATALECRCKISLDIKKDDIRDDIDDLELSISLIRQFYDSSEGKLDGKPLHWHNERDYKIKIARKGHADIDILKVKFDERRRSNFEPKTESIPAYIVIPSSAKGYSTPLAALNPKTYEGTLTLECDNHDTIEKKLTIEYDNSTQKAIVKLD